MGLPTHQGSLTAARRSRSTRISRSRFPTNPIIPVHRGRRHRRRHHAGDAEKWSTPRCTKPTGGKKKIVWMEMFAGEKIVPHLRRERLGCRRRRCKVSKEYVVLDQRDPSPRPVGGWHPLDQRRVAPGSSTLYVLPAAGALVPWRAVAAEEAGGRRHGDLSAENAGGHLRRHRVAGANRPKRRR